MNKNLITYKEISRWFLKRLIYLGPILSIIAVFILFSSQSSTERLVAGALVALGLILFAYGKKNK